MSAIAAKFAEHANGGHYGLGADSSVVKELAAKISEIVGEYESGARAAPAFDGSAEERETKLAQLSALLESLKSKIPSAHEGYKVDVTQLIPNLAIPSPPQFFSLESLNLGEHAAEFKAKIDAIGAAHAEAGKQEVLGQIEAGKAETLAAINAARANVEAKAGSGEFGGGLPAGFDVHAKLAELRNMIPKTEIIIPQPPAAGTYDLEAVLAQAKAVAESYKSNGGIPSDFKFPKLPANVTFRLSPVSGDMVEKVKAYIAANPGASPPAYPPVPTNIPALSHLSNLTSFSSVPEIPNTPEGQAVAAEVKKILASYAGDADFAAKSLPEKIKIVGSKLGGN